MPIDLGSEVRGLEQEEFYGLHRKILGIIFEVHNEFGRFLDERLFKRAIGARCEEVGIKPVNSEVQIRVTHEDFHKAYFVDLLFCHGLPLEAKAVATLTAAHRAQCLNYLMLAGMQHGMLVNLRPERVQHEFVSTRLTQELRRRTTVTDNRWQIFDERSAFFRTKLLALVEDWGAFLEVGLYREAMTHFLGGQEAVLKPVSIFSGNRFLGHQPMHLLGEDSAFSLTAVTGDTARLEDHQHRFLRHTKLKFLQWANFSHHKIEFVTLTPD
jgi:GxxExxY protein